jgi:hypothetical protein
LSTMTLGRSRSGLQIQGSSMARAATQVEDVGSTPAPVARLIANALREIAATCGNPTNMG